MCDKVFLRNGGILKFIPDNYKKQKICDKAVYNYSHALESIPDCFNTQKSVIKLLILILLQCYFDFLC